MEHRFIRAKLALFEKDGEVHLMHCNDILYLLPSRARDLSVLLYRYQYFLPAMFSAVITVATSNDSIARWDIGVSF